MNRLRGTFGRQALPMVWDYAETNPLSGAGGDIYGTAHSLSEVLDKLSGGDLGASAQIDAAQQTLSTGKVVSTDPPYYDNIGYADLSDFFYVWLRRSLRPVFPALFATLAVPKAEELVATPYRHGSKEKAERFFLDGMGKAMCRLSEQAHPDFPVSIYYAFKQSETRGDPGVFSTGWETFLAAVIQSGFAVTGTWPMRTELGSRMIGLGANALASSIVLVCRRRHQDASLATRREFVAALKAELPARPRAPAIRQHRPGRPRPGRHRPRHGDLHPLRQGARRPRPSRLRARCPGADQPHSRRGPGRAGRGFRRRHPAGPWPGSSSRVSPRASTAWPKLFPRPRTPASRAWKRRASWSLRPARCAC